MDFESELQYLIDNEYFNKHGYGMVVATSKGMDSIWGETKYSPKMQIPYRSIKTSKDNVEEIFKLKPEVYGIGINLVSLLKVASNYFKRKNAKKNLKNYSKKLKEKLRN